MRDSSSACTTSISTSPEACASARPACDLAAAAALVSSLSGAALPADSVYFGELGLSGAVRPVSQAATRMKEAAKLGFSTAVIPALRGEADGATALAQQCRRPYHRARCADSGAPAPSKCRIRVKARVTKRRAAGYTAPASPYLSRMNAQARLVGFVRNAHTHSRSRRDRRHPDFRPAGRRARFYA